MPEFTSINGPKAQSNGTPIDTKLISLPGVNDVKLEQIVEAKARDLEPLKIDKAAFYGLAGDVVRTIEPHTEADPVAILLQTLASFGNVIGRTAYYPVESSRHHANLFVVLVGASSKGRKGTAAGRVKAVFEQVDKQWAADRIKGGLSSGEGIIHEVRDPLEKWNPKERETEVVDAGVEDKRLLIIEPEFANTLSVMERAGNTLSPIIRNAWDGETLQTLAVTAQRRATGTHISMVGHIAERELRELMTRTSAANGFGNRFLFVNVRRSKSLPFGGDLALSEICRLGNRVREAVEFARTAGRVGMTPAARERWAAIYEELSAGQDGLLGAITARAEAQTVRLALVYALLDQKTDIDVAHLTAALAVWEYAEASAVRVFGDSLGDPVADDLLAALRKAGTTGLTRTAIRDLFGRNRASERINLALSTLATKGLALMEQQRTGGRPVETWFASERKVM